MFSGSSAIYGAKHQSRAIASVLGDPERHRFLVGSSTLREANELILLEFNEDTNDLHEARTFSHPGEVWSISPSPRDPTLTFTSYSRGGQYDCSLWKMNLPPPVETTSPTHHNDIPRGGGGGNVPSPSSSATKPLDCLMKLPKAQGRVRSALWSVGDEGHGNNSSNTEEKAVTVDDEKLYLWALGASNKEAKAVGSVKITDAKDTVGAAWDPHDSSKVATIQGTDIVWWDLRTMKQAGHTEVAHQHGVRDIDFNHNKPFRLVTCGEDRLIKFWDSRKVTTPVKHLAGHTHWVWTVRYNRCHDQLLLSAGTDSLVNLWRVSSISSAPLLEMEDPSSNDSPDVKAKTFEEHEESVYSVTCNDSPDVKVKTFEEHEESVYSVTWSACDPFVFASVSYDGRVVLNHVPSTEKYKILL